MIILIRNRCLIAPKVTLAPHKWSTLRFLSSKSCDPLRILFCGSDDISIASLRALHAEHIRSPETIASIDVVCRPGKRVGRGLKKIRDVPIKSVAKDLSLAVHEIDTFTGWKPPQPQQQPLNLIVAVSFGLFIPPRILGTAKYGGLNIHPSLLPDFRGPAPIYHTLLAGENRTGVTLQTLHATKFDHGLILGQTEFDIPDSGTFDVQKLIQVAANKGAETLVNGIRNRLFVPPLKPIEPSTRMLERHASKILPEDRHIQWSSWARDRIYRYHKVLGSLWNLATLSETSSPLQKRMIFTDMEVIDCDHILETIPPIEPGLPFALGDSSMQDQDRPLYILTNNKKLIKVNQIKVEGEKAKGAYVAALKAKAIQPIPNSRQLTGQPMSQFYAPLQ